MLNFDKVIVLFLFFILYSCNIKKSSDEFGKEFKEKSIHVIGKEEYINVFSMANDSLTNWRKHNLYADSASDKAGWVRYDYKLDSLFCFDSSKERMIGVLHWYVLEQKWYKKNQFAFDHDGLEEFFGAKINGNWYFWTGGYMAIGREGFKNNDPTKPLSYAQLHEQAMNSFLGGYLTKKGEINDAWFEAKFKGSGWGDFKKRYEYKFILDGNRIDNEDDYYHYVWKKRGLGYWISKAANDSIKEINSLGVIKLTREDENAIRTVFINRIMENN